MLRFMIGNRKSRRICTGGRSMAGLIAAAMLCAAPGVAAAQCDRFDYNTELVDFISLCASSHLPASNVSNNVPGNLSRFDTTTSQAWCEGVPDNGLNEWIEFRSNTSASIKTIYIANGY